MKLNPDSAQLLNYIKNAPDVSEGSKISIQTRKFLTKILNYIIKGDSQQKKYSIGEPSIYKKDQLYSSIPNEIKIIIEREPSVQKSYKFSIKKRKFKVDFIIPTNNPYPHLWEDKVQDSLKIIYTWFYVASQYATNDFCASSLQLYIYFTYHKKFLPEAREGEPANPENLQPIDNIHANTAYTWACIENSTIHIFREEEWFKVLIHESFHTMGLDFSTMDIRKCQKKLDSLFSIKTKGQLFESYCETWATIINSLFLGYFSIKHNHSLRKPAIDRTIDRTIDILAMETKFAIFQSMKVLNYYGLSYSDIINTRNPVNTGKHPKNNKYNENTNMFCYHVLKALMLYYSDDFLIWCDTNNFGSLEFKKTPETLENFCNWIELHYIKNEYIEYYNRMKEWHQKTRKNNYISNNLRMTIFG
jgi:hypothetical protein